MLEKHPYFHQDLTDFAQGYFASPESAIDLSRLFFPSVEVETATGTYTDWRDDTALAPLDLTLTRDNTPRRIELVKTEGTYKCVPSAVEILRNPIDMLQAQGSELAEKGVRKLVSVFFTSRQHSALEIVRAAVPAAVGAGKWRGTTNTATSAKPIDEIDALCAEVALIGRTPTHIVMGRAAWRTLRNHPNVISRVPGLSVAVNEEQFLDTLAYKGMELIIVDGVELEAGSKHFIMDDDVLVFYSSAAPDTEDISFAKEFTLTEDGPEVLEYPDGPNMAHALYASSDRKVTNPNACARLVITTPES